MVDEIGVPTCISYQLLHLDTLEEVCSCSVCFPIRLSNTLLCHRHFYQKLAAVERPTETANNEHGLLLLPASHGTLLP